MRAARFPLLLIGLAMLGLGGGAAAKPAPKRKPQTHKPAPSTPAPSPSPHPAPGTGGDNPDDAAGNGDGVLAASDPAPDGDANAPLPPSKAPPEPAAPPAPERDKEKDRKDAPPPAAGPAPDLQKLRADYDRLRDELYRARARAQIVQEGLYASKLAATVRWKGSPAYVIRRAELRLDGASLWDSGDKPVTDDVIKVAERAVKPGTHALTVRLEIRPGAIAKKSGKEAEQVGYTSEHTFAITVPDGKRTNVAITGDEDGDPPEYEPEIEVELETEK